MSKNCSSVYERKPWHKGHCDFCRQLRVRMVIDDVSTKCCQHCLRIFDYLVDKHKLVEKKYPELLRFFWEQIDDEVRTILTVHNAFKLVEDHGQFIKKLVQLSEERD